MFFLFVCLFFSKISFLHGVVFILDWKLAFFGLNIFFFRNFCIFHTQTHRRAYTHTYTHIQTHTHTHTHNTHSHTKKQAYALHCGNQTVCVAVIAMFVVSLLGATIKKTCIMQ